MTDTEIKENDKLIAEFMGILENKSFKEIDKERLEKGMFVGEPMYDVNGVITNLRYNFSWDWLMPVVEKIENLYDGDVLVEISDESCYIGLHKDYEKYCTIETKIQATWEAVIEFIKWYNKKGR